MLAEGSSEGGRGVGSGRGGRTGCRCESEGGEGENEDGEMHGALLLGLWKGGKVMSLRGGYCCFLRNIPVTVTVTSTFIVRFLL